MSMTPVVYVEMARFDRLINDLAKATRKTVGFIIKSRAGAMARYLAESTQPVGVVSSRTLTDGTVVREATGSARVEEGQITGTGKEIRDMGRNAVLGDIGRVYRGGAAIFANIADKNRARGAYKALKQGRHDELSARLRVIGGPLASLKAMAWDGGALHRRSRNGRGRVNGAQKPLLVDDGRQLAAYKLRLRNRVGLAKSAFTRCSYLITGKWPRGVPMWMKQNAPARAIDRTNDANSPFIDFESNLRYASEALSGWHYALALDRLDDSLKKDMEVQLRRIADRAEKDATR